FSSDICASSQRESWLKSCLGKYDTGVLSETSYSMSRASAQRNNVNPALVQLVQTTSNVPSGLKKTAASGGIGSVDAMSTRCSYMRLGVSFISPSSTGQEIILTRFGSLRSRRAATRMGIFGWKATPMTVPATLRARSDRGLSSEARFQSRI